MTDFKAPITGADLGRGLSVGGVDERKITAHIGAGLFFDHGGRIASEPVWTGTWIHRLLLVLGGLVLFGFGWLGGQWSDGKPWEQVIGIAAWSLFLFGVGWWIAWRRC